LRGATTADVVVLGGGYTGLWRSIVREAIVRTELAEERGERGSRVLRGLSRLPRRLGYHLGPE
jgi:hypothetical protein